MFLSCWQGSNYCLVYTTCLCVRIREGFYRKPWSAKLFHEDLYANWCHFHTILHHFKANLRLFDKNLILQFWKENYWHQIGTSRNYRWFERIIDISIFIKITREIMEQLTISKKLFIIDPYLRHHNARWLKPAPAVVFCKPPWLGLRCDMGRKLLRIIFSSSLFWRRRLGGSQVISSLAASVKTCFPPRKE